MEILERFAGRRARDPFLHRGFEYFLKFAIAGKSGRVWIPMQDSFGVVFVPIGRDLRLRIDRQCRGLTMPRERSGPDLVEPGSAAGPVIAQRAGLAFA